MEHPFNTDIRSAIIEKQQEYLLEKAYEALGEAASPEEVNTIVEETIRRYYVRLGTPLMIPRYAQEGHLPYMEDYNDMIEEMVEDIRILFGEIEGMSDYLADYFNYAQTEKKRMETRIRSLNGLVGDLHLIANDSSGQSIYFRDSFENTDRIESSMIMGIPAQVSTLEGIVTLARRQSISQSPKAKIKQVQGNGESGTYHIVRRVKEDNSQGSETTLVYVSEKIPNDKPEVILDGRPDTVFEYQMVNVPRDVIIQKAKGYDMEWVKGRKDGDRLRLKLVIELEEAVDINWISINPYHPPYSTGKVIVYSIRTSEDGFDYQALYEDKKFVLHAELNTTPQTYRADALFDGKNEFTASKFAGQGVWAFPTRKAKYVEIVMDQEESYPELIGHTYYEKIKKDSKTGAIISRTRIPASQVPENIIKGPSGVYPLDSTTSIEKGIEAFEGWRYAIGIRDILIMSYEYEEKSEIVSTKWQMPEGKKVKEVLLYVNEKIPASYLNEIKTSNDWIQYYISYDDNEDWIRISPMHHQPVNENFPPKIVEFIEVEGGATTTEEKEQFLKSFLETVADQNAAFQLYKQYVPVSRPVTSLRLKIVMQRPKDKDDPTARMTTPIVEDYAIRVVFEDYTEEVES